MIIVRLSGGLGNQMFQYACGRRLSIMRKTDLSFDTKFLEDRSPRENFTFRNLELDTFQKINIKKCNIKTTRRFYNTDLYSRILRKFSYPKMYAERGRQFDPDVLNIGPSAYLDGYWQSEKYFEDIKEVIKNDFHFNIDFENDYIKNIAATIIESNSIGVHVRRGDYVSNQQAKSIYASLSIDYYKKAIDYCTKKVKEARFFIFSDDPEYVEIIFSGIKNLTIVKHSASVSNSADMRLMSLCKHNIIANSSYSWWGAWLNDNTDKIVVAPETWYNTADNYSVIKDRVPDAWHLIPIS